MVSYLGRYIKDEHICLDNWVCLMTFLRWFSYFGRNSMESHCFGCMFETNLLFSDLFYSKKHFNLGLNKKFLFAPFFFLTIDHIFVALNLQCLYDKKWLENLCFSLQQIPLMECSIVPSTTLDHGLARAPLLM